MTLDLAGHEKYLKTTVYGVTGLFPDYGIVVIGANTGITRLTREHIGILFYLKIPFVVCITKIDIAPKHVYQLLCNRIKNFLSKNTIGKITYFISDSENSNKETDNYLKTMYDKLKYKNQSLFYSFLQNLYRGGHAFRNYLDGTQNVPLQHTAWHMRAFMMVHRNFRKYLGAIFDMLYSFSVPDSYCKTVLFMVTFVLVFLIHFAGIGWLLLGGTYVFAIILYCAEMAFGGAPGVFGLGLTPFGGFGTFIFGLAVCASVSVSGLWLYYKCLLVAQSRKVIFCLLRNNGCIITILFGMAIVYSAFQHLNKFSAMTMLVLFLIMGFKTLKMHFNNCKDLGKGYVCDSEKFFNSVQNLRSYNE